MDYIFDDIAKKIHNITHSYVPLNGPFMVAEQVNGWKGERYSENSFLNDVPTKTPLILSNVCVEW